MRALRVSLVLASLLFVFAAGASANTIDPVIVVRGGSGTITLTNPGPIQIAFPGQPGCTTGTYGVPGPFFGLPWMECVFKNNTGTPFSTLHININSAQLPLTLQCAVICTAFVQTPTGGTATFYFNPPIPSGTAPDFEFAIDFINFAPGTNFSLTPNVPEPATLVLFSTGAVAVWWKRRQLTRG